jgi:hypothetical protein
MRLKHKKSDRCSKTAILSLFLATNALFKAFPYHNPLKAGVNFYFLGYAYPSNHKTGETVLFITPRMPPSSAQSG